MLVFGGCESLRTIITGEGFDILRPTRSVLFPTRCLLSYNVHDLIYVARVRNGFVPGSLQRGRQPPRLCLLRRASFDAPKTPTTGPVVGATGNLIRVRA